MKNLFTLILAIFCLSFAFTSCGDDDDETQTLGGHTFIFVSVETVDCDDPSDNEELETNNLTKCTTADEDCDYYEWTFSNGLLTAVNTYSYDGELDVDTETYTYTIDGNKITICPEITECIDGTFTFSGDEATLNMDTSEDSSPGCRDILKLRKI